MDNRLEFCGINSPLWARLTPKSEVVNPTDKDGIHAI